MIESMIYYVFDVEIPQNPWNPYISQITICDLGLCLKKGYYEIMLVVHGVLKLC